MATRRANSSSLPPSLRELQSPLLDEPPPPPPTRAGARAARRGAARARALDGCLCLALGACAAGWALVGALRGWPRHWLRPAPRALALWRARARAPVDWESVCSACALACALGAACALLARARTRARARAKRSSAELDRAGLLSQITFWWVVGTLRAAARVDALRLEQLPQVAASDVPARLFRRFRARWARRGGGASGAEPSRAPGRAARPRPRAWSLLWLVLVRVQPWVFLRSLCAGWLFLGSMLLDPLLLGAVLRGAQAHDAAGRSGRPAAPGAESVELWSVLLLSANMLLRVCCMELCYFHSVRAAANARAALVVALFRAALLAPDAAELARRADASGAPPSGSLAGRLTNLMATDADKLGKSEALVWSIASWTWAVGSLPVVLWQTYTLLGSAALVGVGTLLLSNQLSWAVMRCTQPVVRRLQARRDARGALLAELLGGVRLIKLSGSEGAWAQRLTVARDEELRELALMRYLGAGAQLVAQLLSLGVPAVIFGWYTLAQRRVLTPAVAFTALAWIQQMRWSISVLPGIYGIVGSLLPTLERLARALDALDELPPAGRAEAEEAAEEGDDDEDEAEEAEAAELGDQGEAPPPGVAAQLVDALVLHGGGALGEAAPAAAPAAAEARALEPGCAEGGEAQRDGSSRVVLARVSLSLGASELLLLCGPVGAGKSSLLEAMARARPLGGGECRAARRRAFVSQKPFLLSGTVRENVLFGLPMEAGRYAEAIERAQLAPELRELSRADETCVGEGGVQLSGGQRARVALARALYADADAYFLDDVLAAVDAHTGRALWEGAVLHLAARGKAVALATHALQWAAHPRVSRVALLGSGRLLACAPYAQLLRACREAEGEGGAEGGASDGAAEAGGGGGLRAERHASIRALLLYGGAGDAGARAGGSGADGGGAERGGGGGALGVGGAAAPACAPAAERGASAPPDESIPPDERELSVRAARRLVRSALHAHEGRTLDRALVRAVAAELGASRAEAEEVRRVGLIAPADFAVYLRVFGSAPSLLLLLLCALGSALLGIGANLWLSRWSDANAHCAQGAEGAEGAEGDCSEGAQRAALLRYLLLGVGGQLCAALETVCLTLCALRASRALHAQLLSSLLGAPMAFFDAHGSGSVLNRFLQDVQSMDSYVPNTLLDTAAKLLQMGTQLGLVLALAPWAACALPLLLPLYAAVFRAVRPAARDTRRLEARAHSPVYAHFADALAGRETVRAFGAEGRFCAANARLVTAMSRAKVGNEAVCKWAQALSTQNGCVLYGACGLACVLLNSAHALSAAQLGLVLLYAASLQRAAMDLMMQLTVLETQFVSIERLAEFTRLDAEADEDEDGGGGGGTERAPPPAGWPSGGGLELRDVWLRYRAHRPPALKGLCLRVAPGAKVAVCGATGCGKSSLFAALSRLYPLDRGDVLIDGLSATRQLSLAHVRRAVRVLSQDAALLDGSLRANLRADFGEEAAAAAAAHAPSALARALGLCGHGRFYGRAAQDEAAARAAARADEDALWGALRRARCDALVAALPHGLDTRVKGGDFSEGERQLLALARALLRHPAVLLADEPTSCVDLVTDEAVHGALLGLDATVLMICHRLQHVGRFDEVVVMDDGRVVEQGPPARLLRDPSSRLAGLCARAGLEPDEVLARAAPASEHESRLDVRID